MGASDTTGNASVVDGKLISETENNKTLKRASATANMEIESVRGNDGVVFNGKLFTSVSIGTGISNSSDEQMCRKFKCEQLQQWSLILFALNRQKSQYQQLRERLSKIGEGRVVKKELVIDNICNVCSCQINIIDSESFITCFVCNKRICHAAKCSSLVPRSGRWECRLCHSSKDSLTNTQSWIAEQIFFNRQKYVYPMRARSEIYIPIRDYSEGFTNFEGVNQTGIDSSVITLHQKTKIREYVEEVVAKLLGGSLDQIRVTQLSKSENNLPGILNKQVVHQHPVGLNDNQINENILTQFSEISQTRLRHMVESIITEMLETPSLTNVNVSEPELNTNTYGIGRPRLCHRHRTEHYFEPNPYQDFLATAVLNKISDKEGNFRQFSESTPDLSSCNIDDFNMNNRSTSSDSSLEPINGFSYTDAEYSPKIIKDLNRESTINDYIASHAVPLPDLSAVTTESEEDDNASVSSSILREGNWENNWLFRKKRSSLTTSVTGSIGMLVPAPKNDVRAQIGDKTTDEISDLSEIDSDTDDSSVKICAGLDPFNDRILNKHLIGGQNTKVILDELIETASLISNTSHSPNEANYIESMNEHIVEIASKPEAFNSGVPNKLPYEAEISLKSTPEGCYEVHTTPEVENNPLSDQLSSATNLADKNVPTTIESYLVVYNNEQDIIHTNNCNNSFVNTTKLTNGSFPNLTPNSKSNGKQGQQFVYNNNYQRDNNGEEDDVVPLRHFVPGSIAEREYKKWNNAVEMPNNPYSLEALKRRISGSQERFIDLPNISSSTNKNVITVKAEDDAENESTSNIGYKRYSRDYYINTDNTPEDNPNHQILRNDRRKRINSGCSEEVIKDTVTKEVNSYGKTKYKSIPLYGDHSNCQWILSTPVRRSNSLKCINHRTSQKSCYNFTPNTTSTAPTYYKVLSLLPRSFTSASHYDNLDRIHLQKTNHRNDSYKYSNRIYNETRPNEYENDGGRLDTDNKIDLDYCNDDKRSQRSRRSASVAANYSETLPKRRTLSSLSFYSTSSTNDMSLNSPKSKNLVLSNAIILSKFEKQLLHKDLKRNSFRAISATTKDFVMNPLYEREKTLTASTDPNNNKSRANLLTEGVNDDQIDSGVESFLHCFVETNTNADNTSFLI